MKSFIFWNFAAHPFFAKKKGLWYTVNRSPGTKGILILISFTLSVNSLINQLEHLHQSPNPQSNYRIRRVDRKLVLQQSPKTFPFPQ